jgi:hypothetical protein
MTGATRGLASAIVVVACAACAARPRGPSGGVRSEGVEVTLYRDHVVIAHRLRVEIPPAAPATVRLRVGAGIDPDDLYLVESSPLKLVEIRRVGSSATPDELAPFELELVIGGPHEGSFVVAVGYDTDRITWDVAYTLTTTEARDRAVLRGVLAIRNATGIALRGARLAVVDAEHGPNTSRVSAGSDASDPLAARELGRVDLASGDTRLDLIANPRPQAMRTVLVYDPIGTRLDHPGDTPVRDPLLGVRPPPGIEVTESFEIERDLMATASLPEGPVRLFERHADGSLAQLGEARIFRPSTRKARVDTIPIGKAERVTGKRERRELTIDDARKRLVEEIAITIDNQRDVPIEVVLREHLYRGETWTLAYLSIPVDRATQEGSQQVAMRLAVPPRSQRTLLYAVVYWWGK